MAILIPETEEQVCEAVRDAGEAGQKLELRGGGTHADVGAPQREAQVLSLRRIAGIVDYDNAELVLTARAGTPLAEIRAAVAERGQHLAFDPYGAPGATIGGVVGAAISGSRRVSAGAVRDHLLGFRAVSGRGESFVAGAKVVKNVTGYDLPKVMCGSWGRLAALTEVTFKILPAPQESRTLEWQGLSLQDAWQLMARAMGLPADVAAAGYLPASDASSSRTLVRIEGFAPSVAARSRLLSAELAGFGAPAIREGQDHTETWGALERGSALPPKLPLWRLSVPLGKGLAVARACEEQGYRWLADWAGGLIWLASEAGESDIRQLAHEAGGHASLLRAPAAVRTVVPALQLPLPGVAALNARLRRAFDPLGLFETGRFLDTFDAN